LYLCSINAYKRGNCFTKDTINTFIFAGPDHLFELWTLCPFILFNAVLVNARRNPIWISKTN
jgi:hypothetical protein